MGEVAHQGKVYPGEHEGIVARELWEQVQQRLRDNSEARRNGTRASSPSLLAGIIHDGSGRRITPTHAVKTGKRYRYYVLWAFADHVTGAKTAKLRIPAHDLKWAVMLGLRNFLADHQTLLEALRPDRDHAYDQQALLDAAQNHLTNWPELSPVKQRGFLLSVLNRVTVKEQAIEIAVNRHQLLETLTNRAITIAQSRPSEDHPGEKEDVIRLTVEARFIRAWRKIRLILPNASSVDQPTVMNTPLIKAIARAWGWYEQLTSGKNLMNKDLAIEAGLNERYVSRILRCAFLAPDIVEAILQGRQPVALTLAQVLDDVPLDWNEQRAVFGFPALN